MKRKFAIVIGLFFFSGSLVPAEAANEVIQPAVKTQMIKRIHPGTNQEIFSIVEAGRAPQDLWPETASRFSRPDYRILERDSHQAEIYYDGPVSDRKKVYIFAGTVAAGGTVAGTAGLLTAASSTAGTTSAAGAGAYAAGGTAIISGIAGTVAIKTREQKDQPPFIHEAQAIHTVNGMPAGLEQEERRII